jgi:hypothetical protein
MTMDRQKTKEEVIDALHGVASEMHDKMLRGNPPTMTLPVRSKSNIGFDKKLGVYKYGKKRTIRDATSLGSARQLLREVASLIVLFFPYLYTPNFLSNPMFDFDLTGRVIVGGFPLNILSCISEATPCNASITSSFVFCLSIVIQFPPIHP